MGGVESPASQRAKDQRHPSEANKGRSRVNISPSSGGGLWSGVLRPNNPDCRRHTPGESLLFWGEGWGWPDNELQRSPTRPAMASLRGGCARVRAIHPSSSSRVSRLEEPGHDRLGGRGLGASWRFARSRPPKAPHGLLLARPRQEPMPRCNSEALTIRQPR
jgi:hypothetical protein